MGPAAGGVRVGCTPLGRVRGKCPAHRIMGCGARSASEAYRIVGMSCGGARRRDHLFTRRSSSSIHSVGRAVRRRVSRSRAREFAARTQLRPQHPRPQSSPRRSVARKRTFKLLADSRAHVRQGRLFTCLPQAGSTLPWYTFADFSPYTSRGCGLCVKKRWIVSGMCIVNESRERRILSVLSLLTARLLWRTIGTHILPGSRPTA